MVACRKEQRTVVLQTGAYPGKVQEEMRQVVETCRLKNSIRIKLHL